MGRIALLDIAQLPHIVPLLQVPDGWRAVIVTAKKLGWYRIIYDDGEREGWLQGRSAYQYHRWQQLLPGKRVALSGGLRKEFYQLRSTPDLAAKPLETIDRESSLTVISVAGDWINVRCGAAVNGWLRWCDDNWRLQIAVDLKAAPP